MWKRLISNVWVRILAVVVVAVVLFVAIWSVEYDRPIAREQLPTQAQQFMSAHYAERPVVLIQKELNELRITYEVAFNDGTKLEFRKNGAWREVDCGMGDQVPAELIPQQIATYVQENFPGSVVTRIEQGKRRYEIELNNRLELTFDARTFLVTEYDD